MNRTASIRDRFGAAGAAVANVAAAVLGLGGCALYRSHDRRRMPPEVRDA